jgi:hypothetical protein
MTAALKPCPFCGGEAGPGIDRAVARCRSCGAEGPFHVAADFDDWNRRAVDPALAAAEARAEKAEALAREAGRVVVMLAGADDDVYDDDDNGKVKVDWFAALEHARDLVEKIKALAPTTTEGGAK